MAQLKTASTVGGNTIFHDAHHPNADKLTTARTIALSGGFSGSTNFDGSSNITISTTSNGGGVSAVTPTWTKTQRILASDKEAGDLFGDEVAISDDGHTAIVGSRGEGTGATTAGAAYIYKWFGYWLEIAKIQSNNTGAFTNFGHHVSISGDGHTVVVGAIGHDTNGTDSGAAYIFSDASGAWAQTAALVGSDTASGDVFGESVSISAGGQTVLVGARYNDSGGSDSGAAYVFSNATGTWVETIRLTASDAQANDSFGSEVTISGDGITAIIGARMEDTGGSNIGAAYVFSNATGTWTETIKLGASDAQGGDNFGSAVSLSGDGLTAIVGAARENTGGTNAGAAYIFSNATGTWTETAIIQASDKQSQDKFGWYASISGDGLTAIVGGTSTQAAYIFTDVGGVWTETIRITAYDTGTFIQFGGSVSMSGDGKRALVGAYDEFVDGIATGAAFMFELN
jgi:hypothetical protein